MHFSINDQRINTPEEFKIALSSFLREKNKLPVRTHERFLSNDGLPSIISAPAPVRGSITSALIQPRYGKRIDVLPYEFVFIDTSVTAAKHPDNDPYYFHVHRAYTGITLYFYNDAGEQAMLSIPGIITIPDWKNMFVHFVKSHNIKIVITGGATSSAEPDERTKAIQFISKTIECLYSYATKDGVKINIDINGAQILDQNKVDDSSVYASITPYLYNTLNMLSRRYCSKSYERQISFEKPSTNFSSKYTGSKNHIDAAISLIECALPYATIPFESLPSLDVKTPDEYIKRLGEVLFSRQAARILGDGIRLNEGPDLTNFMVRCDNHVYSRTNDYYDNFPDLPLRLARNIEKILLRKYNIHSFNLTPTVSLPTIKLSPNFIVFLQDKAKDFYKIQSAQLDAFMDAQINNQYEDEDEASLRGELSELNAERMLKLLFPLRPRDETLDQLARDLLYVLGHYKLCPSMFIGDSPLVKTGFFAHSSKNQLDDCKILLDDMTKGTGVTINAYKKSHSLDIVAGPNSLVILTSLSKSFNTLGIATKIDKLDDESGSPVIRLKMSNSVANAITNTYVLVGEQSAPSAVLR